MSRRNSAVYFTLLRFLVPGILVSSALYYTCTSIEYCFVVPGVMATVSFCGLLL